MVTLCLLVLLNAPLTWCHTLLAGCPPGDLKCYAIVIGTNSIHKQSARDMLFTEPTAQADAARWVPPATRARTTLSAALEADPASPARTHSRSPPDEGLPAGSCKLGPWLLPQSRGPIGGRGDRTMTIALLKTRKPADQVAESHTLRAWTKEQIAKKLETNHTWLIRGILAIYARQTSEEQSTETTRNLNSVGFSAWDAGLLSSFAKQILAWQDGRSQYKHPLSERQLEKARKKMKKYAGQLAQIANG